MGVLFKTGCLKSKSSSSPPPTSSPSPERVVAPLVMPTPSRDQALNVIHFNEHMPATSLPGLLLEHDSDLYELVAVDFEIFGTVQGVNFREYTKEQADRLGLRGWCKNTPRGTVLGRIEGPEDNIETMMNWLQSKGSPTCTIEKAEFRNQEDIVEYSYEDFTIRRD